jgi:Tfp pilus assembly protein PilN
MRKIQFIKSSATGATKENESDDCTVRALANATAISYAKAHAALKHHGRQDKKGVTTDVIVPAYKTFGLNLVSIHGDAKGARYLKAWYSYVQQEKGITLKTFLDKADKNKKYVLLTRDHALAVVNSEVIDTFDNRANKRVVAVFEYSL